MRPSPEQGGGWLVEACDECGTKLVDNCAICGAPVCCPRCCREDMKEQGGIRLKNRIMGNRAIACNYCGKPQTLVIPYAETDRISILYLVAKAFLVAVEMHNASPFDLAIEGKYNSAKADFIKVFEFVEDAK